MAETEHSTPALDTSTRLAFDRTRVAYERTMMAWIRTATSLITFGFAVYKFFQIEAPSSGEIMEVLKLCVVQGVQACNLGVPILAGEIAKVSTDRG
jgi:uncharacterized membrane protein YidH (DUF202 family)